MNKIIMASSLILSGNAVAHVSHASQVQHTSEHLLLAALLIPVAWIVVRKVFK